MGNILVKCCCCWPSRRLRYR